MDLTNTPEEARREVSRALAAELKGDPVTVMMPYTAKRQLVFQHKWVMLVGGKLV